MKTKLKLAFQNPYLISAFLFGAFFRFYRINAEGLWIDEIYSLKFSRFGFSESLGLIQKGLWDTHPPLYFYLLKIWIFFTGHSEIALRSFSSIFGIATIYLFYRFSCALFGEKTARVAALILALSPFHVYYGQNARDYTLLVFAALTSFYSFYNLLTRNDSRDKVVYFISSLFFLYTHNYAVFFVVTQNLIFFYLLLSRKNLKLDLRAWLVLQTLVGFCFLPWIFVVLKQSLLLSGNYWLLPPDFLSIIRLFRHFSGTRPLLILMAGLAFLSLRRIKSEPSPSTVTYPMLLAWILIPIIISWSLSRLSTPIFHQRYLIACSLPLYLLVAKGLSSIQKKSVQIILLACILLVSAAKIIENSSQATLDSWKEDWRGATKILDIYAQPGELLIFNSGFSENAYIYYTQRKNMETMRFPDKVGEDYVIGLHKPIQITQARLDSLALAGKSYPRIWLIKFGSEDHKNLLSKKLTEDFHYRLASNQLFKGGIEIFEFAKIRSLEDNHAL